MSAYDPMMEYFHAKPAATQAQLPFVRVPVEVVVRLTGASSITHRMLPAWQYGRLHVAHDRAHKRALVRELTWAEALRQRIEAFVASTPGTGA